MSSNEGQSIGSSPMILRSRKRLQARRHREPFFSRVNPLRPRLDIEKVWRQSEIVRRRRPSTTKLPTKGKNIEKIVKRRSSDSDIVLKGKDIEKKLKRYSDSDIKLDKRKEIEKKPKKRRSSDSDIILGKGKEIEKKPKKRRSSDSDIILSKGKGKDIEKKLTKRRSSDTDIILKGKDIEKKLKRRSSDSGIKLDKGKEIEKKPRKRRSADSEIISQGYIEKNLKKRRSAGSGIIEKGKDIEKKKKKHRATTEGVTAKGKDIKKNLKIRRATTEGVASKGKDTKKKTKKRKSTTEGVASKGKDIVKNRREDIKKKMKKRRATTEGRIKTTKGKDMEKKRKSIEKVSKSLMKGSDEDALPPLDFESNLKKRKRTPTKLFSQDMEKKVHKRRKTTEGPFSENIEKKIKNQKKWRSSDSDIKKTKGNKNTNQIKLPLKSYMNAIIAAIQEDGSLTGMKYQDICTYIQTNYEITPRFRNQIRKKLDHGQLLGIISKRKDRFSLVDTTSKKGKSSKRRKHSKSEPTGLTKNRKKTTTKPDTESTPKGTKRSGSRTTPERQAKNIAKEKLNLILERKWSHPLLRYSPPMAPPTGPTTPKPRRTRAARTPPMFPLQHTLTQPAGSSWGAGGVESALIEWKFESGSPAFAVAVDKITNLCWMGNQNGNVFCLEPSGKEIVHNMKLSSGIKCVVSDSHWHYACCDDGKVYDLTTGVPRVAYELPQTEPVVKEVVFVLDYSGSMRGQKINTSVKNMEMIYREHCKENDKVSFIRFSHFASVIFNQLQKSTSDEIIKNHFKTSLSPDGGTAIFDALSAAWNQFSQDTGISRWVVCVTDGLDGGSRVTPETVREKAAQTGVNVIIISVDLLSHPSCELVCKASKRGVFLPVSLAGIDDAFKMVSQMMSGQALWLDIRDGVLCISGAFGELTACNIEGEVMWQAQSEGTGGWMARADYKHLYHGHSAGITKYGLRSGVREWHVPSKGPIFFGTVTQNRLYVASEMVVESVEMEQGQDRRVYNCDNRVVSNVSSSDGLFVFAADADQCLYCFDVDGSRKWKVKLGCGSALSMDFHNERIYVVTTEGVLACLDPSLQAKPRTEAPEAARVVTSGSVAEVGVSSSVNVTLSTQGRVLVECVKEGAKLRIRPVSAPYYPEWNVQFPRDIRKEGSRYVVDQLVESVTGGFYRAKGAIHELATATSSFLVFDITQDTPLNVFVKSQSLTFAKGSAFYQFMRNEVIQKYKEVVIMDNNTGDIFQGEAVRALLALPDDEDIKLNPVNIGKYTVFIQSTSANRTLKAGTKFLFKK